MNAAPLYCDACGTANQPQARFCFACGQSLPGIASEDRTAQVWDADTGRSTFIYRGHSHYVNAVTWSPDGKYIASASIDRTVQVWEPATGQKALTYLDHAEVIYQVVWSPDGSRIASGSNDKTVQVWLAE